MNDIPSTLLTDDVGYAEAPRWHDGLLWFSDIVVGAVRTVDESGTVRTVAEVSGKPSGLGFLPDGTPLVVSMHERCLYRLEPEGPVLAADLSAHVSYNINDMVVDRYGRGYVGNLGCDLLTGEEPKPTHLLMVHPDGTVQTVAEDLIVPNGMAITADGGTLYVAESMAQRISAYDVAEDGTLSNRRTHGEVGQRTPDGICLDGEGNLWFAAALEGEYARLGTDGTIDTIVKAKPGRISPAVALGGPDGLTLFLPQAETSILGLGRGESVGFIETATVTTPRGADIP